MDKKTYLIVFDISGNKKRRRVTKLLLSYGIRIQESVFECFVTEYSIVKIIKKLSFLLDDEIDKVKIYKVFDQNCIFTFGNHQKLIKDTVCFV